MPPARTKRREAVLSDAYLTRKRELFFDQNPRFSSKVTRGASIANKGLPLQPMHVGLESRESSDSVPASVPAPKDNMHHLVVEKEGEDQSESQQFLALVKYGARQMHDAKRGSDFLDSFRAEIQDQYKSLTDRITMLEKEANSRDEHFISRFREAYVGVIGPSERSPLDISSSSTPYLDTDRLRKQSESIMKTATKLLKLFEIVATSIDEQSVQDANKEKWDKEVGELKYILRAGYQLGQMKVETLLSSDSTIAEAEHSDAVRSLFRATDGESTWGEDARKQKKLVKKLIESV